MRKTYLLLFMLFASMVAMAGPITPDEARQKITKFMSPRRSAAVLQDLRLVATSHYQEQSDVMSPSYYVFNVGEGQGFIIAGADDRIPAVLGYSDRGSFDPENMPVNMQAWLKGYNAQMEYLNQHPEAAAPRRTVNGSSIEPLLACEWNQGNPYNSLCPMDGDKRSVTGCVATAMAQVMYFWKHPTYTVAEIPGYTTSSKGLTVSAIAAGAAIDWDNMLPKYNGSETDAQIEAVASLMLMCGTAVQMNYTSGSSGAVTRRVADSWKDYFDYDAATNYENRSKYRLAAWNQKVYDELKAGRPVLYDGQSSGGGHAFVIDGYGGDDYFHVNWGWGGGSNDYFLLSILDSDNSSGIGASSSSDGYSFDQGAIFGAQPNTGVSPIVTPILTTSEVRTDFAEVSRTDVTEDFLASASANCWNLTGANHIFEYGYGVFDTEGQLLSAVPKDVANLDPSYGFNSFTCTLPLGANVSSGTYYLKPISREAGSETWYANLGTETNYLTATISDNTLTVMAPKFDLTGSVDASGKMEVGVPLTLTATITNNGTLYNGQLFLLVGGTSKENMVGGRHFDIDPGATETIDFTFTPKTAGANDIYICTREYYSGSYDYTPFITGSVTIDAASEATLTMTPKTKNAVREDNQWVVKESKAIVSIDVTNTGSTDYDNDVIVKLYKLTNGNQGSPAGTFKKGIQLAAGASTTAEVELTGLEDGATYFYYVYYMSAGEEVQGYQYSPMFTVKIEGEEPPQEVTKFTVQAIDVAGTLKTNDEVDITVSVKNEGNVQTGTLYYFINNIKEGEIEVDIAAGETKAYSVKYKPTAAKDYTIKVTTDEAGETLAGEESAATKTFTVKNAEKGDPELAIQANEHFDEALGYFTAKIGQPYNSPQLSNPHNVSPIVWTSSDSSVATVDENGIVTIVGMGGTQIRADFAGNDDYKAGYAEYYLYVSDVVNYNTNDDGTVTVTGGDVSGDVEIASTVVINGQAYQVTGIADEAFKGNTTITSVTIPEGITTIGASAFDGCSNMMTVIIGKDVATIGEKAFANIGTPANAPRRAEGDGMKVECYAENVPTTAANAFEASPISNGTLLVDDNSVMAYYAAEPWSLFGTIKGFNGTEPTAIKALWADGNGTAQIFSLDGRKHGEAQKSDLMRVLNTLPKGVYIIRVGQNSKTMHN